MIDLLTEEATRAYGTEEEACGYLTGPAEDGLLADRAVPMPNLANKYHALDPEGYPRKGNTYFLLDSRKFQLAMKVHFRRVQSLSRIIMELMPSKMFLKKKTMTMSWVISHNQ